VNRYFSGRFQRDICVIYPGEMFVSNEDIFIGTVLGSCISIALFDEKQGLGGLNHFMLPSGSLKSDDEDVGRYGDYAIELLINDMMKKGAKKESLIAKVFGGGAVLKTGSESINKTGENNIQFALSFLETEKIPIVSRDVGGDHPRKIFFHPQTSKVYLKRIIKQASAIEELQTREAAYRKNMKNSLYSGDVILF